MQILASALLLTALIFTGCKKGETGPAGAAGATGATGPVVNLSNAGYITGTLTGTRQDGTPFTEPFSYTYYFTGLGASGKLDSISATSYNFNMSRSVNDIFSNDNANVSVNTTSKTSSTGTLYLNFTFEKSLGTNKTFYFSTSASPSTTATGLSYNASTGLFSGNFNVSLTGGQNTSGNSATIVGSFQGIMDQQYSFKQHVAEIKTN